MTEALGRAARENGELYYQFVREIDDDYRWSLAEQERQLIVRIGQLIPLNGKDKSEGIASMILGEIRKTHIVMPRDEFDEVLSVAEEVNY